LRVLLISDLHGNWPALEAIDEPFDLCLCMGDLVDYGCQPAPVVEWVRRRAAACVRGNHDHMVAQNVQTNGVTGFRFLSGVTRPVARQRLDANSLQYLARLPVSKFLTIDRQTFMMVHATPRDPLDEYAPPDPELWKRRLEGVGADVVCVGHTHQPFVLQVGRTMVINPGSVGLPRDGDPRASYAIWDDGQVTMHRIEYAVERTVEAVEASAIPDLAKSLLAQVYRTGALPNGSHKLAESASRRP